MAVANPKLLVARGYDKVADEYVRWRTRETRDSIVTHLDRATDGLPRGARVLDVGCGAGMPYAAHLSERFEVVGVDISHRQLALAHELVRGASFLRADMCALPFASTSFDAIVALYSIIHVPKEEHETLFRSLREMLRQGGRLLAVVGSQAWEGTESDWLVRGAEMFWSHFDGEHYLRLIADAGFNVLNSSIEPDPLGGAHLFVHARKP
ncbi:MAG: class I SAM-dependent methyltransferase [Dehalococcoidia bacterium]